MNDYVAKPITPELLFAVLTRWTRPDHVENIHSEKQTAFSRLETDIELPESLPGIHVYSGVARMAGNVKAYCRMLKDLLHFGVATTAKISQLVKEDINLAIREIHTLKGTAANLSATDLQKVSLEFERNLREIAENSGDENKAEKAALVVEHHSVLIEKQLVQLETSLAQLNELFAKTKESVRVSRKVEIDHEQLFEILTRLKGMSESFDPMAEEYWLEHKYGFLGQDIDEEITRMENHLRNYNFERAVDFIGRIERVLKEADR